MDFLQNTLHVPDYYISDIADTDYRPLLLDYLKYAEKGGGHTHHCLPAAFAMHDTFLCKGDMRLTDWAEYVK